MNSKQAKRKGLATVRRWRRATASKDYQELRQLQRASRVFRQARRASPEYLQRLVEEVRIND